MSFRISQAHVASYKLAPIYEEVADAFAHQKSKVVVAKVDADGAGRETGFVVHSCI